MMGDFGISRRTYQRPAATVYEMDELWRELGPAQAITPGRRPSIQKLRKREMPANPLRIPPSK